MLKAVNLTQQVSISDGELHILKGINLEIKQGETVAIVGASGSGKSTLLGMLAGLDVPSSGEVLINNLNVSNMDEEQRAAVRSQWVAFVFQSFQLLGSLTALENVMLPLEVRGSENAQTMAEEMLARVGLQERLHHKPAQLSGGEQQRVALARAFACQAPIIFADEPTGNLDAETGEKISDLLFELNRENNTTLILVTHAQSLADKCQRTLHMQAGVLTEAGE
ncbi:Lipoprotein-releasing system ATP-binding protein LolD [Thalassocella blandensis]|nr:Lipoprotein-releasing system ATP-binding protein LolD [Thalassocella blandensis]